MSNKKTFKMVFTQTNKLGLRTERSFEVDVKPNVPFEYLRADLIRYVHGWINRQRSIGKYGLKFGVPTDVEISIDGTTVNSTKLMRARVQGFEEGIKLPGTKSEKFAKFLKTIEVLTYDFELLSNIGKKVDKKLTVDALIRKLEAGIELN